MEKGKIAIIGSGYVGAAIAYALTYIENVRQVVLVDICKNASEGEALDISHGIGELSTVEVIAGDYDECRDCEVIVITAGKNRRPEQKRMELLEGNKEIYKDVLDKLQNVYQESFVIVVSNPVDALTSYVAMRGFVPPHKLCGTGCMLDSSRWVREISNYLKIENSRVTAYAVGEHGSGQRVKWEYVSVDGMPIGDYCQKYGVVWNEQVRLEMHSRVTNMGADIIRRKGKTQYGIATVVAYLVKHLMESEKVMVSVSTVLGESDVVESKLVYIGKDEIEYRASYCD